MTTVWLILDGIFALICLALVYFAETGNLHIIHLNKKD